MAEARKAIEIYISYSTKDKELKIELEKRLAKLEEEGLITIWSDSKILPGSDWQQELHAHLNTAKIILFLVSPDFLTSQGTFSEMEQALERSNAQQIRIIPIILHRAPGWNVSPIGKFLGLPSHGRPVSEWPTPDEAYLDIVSGIRQIVQGMLAEESSSNASPTSVMLDEEKQAQAINGNDLGNPHDPNSKIGTGPTAELDQIALFRRLSPSAHQAFNEAEGIRTALGQQEVHMEHLMAGLLAKKGGPTEELLGKASIDVGTLGAVVEASFPQVGSYKLQVLTTLPRMSDHVRRALVAARDIADLQGSDPVRSRHLLYGALSITNCHVIQALVARGIRKEDIKLDTTPLGSAAPSRHVISGFTSDDPAGKDLLDIKKEVEALCSVLAAKDVEPPLSLGLFGD